MKLTIFILLEALPAWLSLTRDERNAISGEALAHAFRGPEVRLRFYDAECFDAGVSDVAVIEADTLEAYYFAMERLRDTVLIARPYFRVVRIIPAYENGFRTFEQVEASEGGQGEPGGSPT